VTSAHRSYGLPAGHKARDARCVHNAHTRALCAHLAAGRPTGQAQKYTRSRVSVMSVAQPLRDHSVYPGSFKPYQR
jgi:hypothetical protein